MGSRPEKGHTRPSTWRTASATTAGPFALQSNRRDVRPSRDLSKASRLAASPVPAADQRLSTTSWGSIGSSPISPKNAGSMASTAGDGSRYWISRRSGSDSLPVDGRKQVGLREDVTGIAVEHLHHRAMLQHDHTVRDTTEILQLR